MIVMRSSDVPDARLPGVGFSAGSPAPSSPGERNRKVQLPGSPTCHLDLALFGVDRRNVAKPWRGVVAPRRNLPSPKAVG